MNARRSFFPLTFALGLSLPSLAHSRTWQVHNDGFGDAPTIQAGIDSAAAGDTVLVHPGTYLEAIDYLGKTIVLRSLAGPEVTTIDATGRNTWAVLIQGVGSREAVLEGMRITGGNAGVFIHTSQPSIRGNIIVGNEPGGGILGSASNFSPWFPLIQGNTIINNRSSNLGGGIQLLQRMVPDILDNYVADNEAIDGDGGGIYVRSFPEGLITIRGNTVVRNKAGDHGGGIYVAMINSPPPALQAEISWNLIANNVAHGSAITGVSGGGLHLIETDAWVHHNTIVGNEGGGAPSTLGGGIGVERIGSPLIEKNIIAFTTQGGGVNCVGGATPTLRDNLAWENAGGHGVGQCSDWWQSNGNVVENPYFCDMAAADFRVASNSGVMTHPAGPLGAFSDPGCGPVAVLQTTWGRIKAIYK